MARSKIPADTPYHEGHDCPKCGAEEQVWCDIGRSSERHTHKCESCGAVWQHDPAEPDNLDTKLFWELLKCQTI